MWKYCTIICAVLLVWVISSCGEKTWDVDTSKSTLAIEFQDWTTPLQNEKGKAFLTFRDQAKQTDTELWNYQQGYCLRIQNVSDSELVARIQAFQSDPNIQEISAEIKRILPKAQAEEEAIKLAFKRLSIHFPNKPQVEHVVFMNSLFAANCFATQHSIGVGLERYLGKNSAVIKKLPNDIYFDWVKEGMDLNFLQRDAVMAWLMTYYTPENSEYVAEHIVNWGKCLYIAHAVLPDLPEDNLLRYANTDLAWADENQYAFWRYLQDEKLLFSTDERTIANLCNDGPFTPGLPQKGPDRLGQYLGYQMVKQYAENNDLTLQELLELPYNEYLQAFEVE